MINEIKQAQNRIWKYIVKTPLVYSQSFSEMFGYKVYLKLENLQMGGSFKIRGALNKILINHEEATHGIIAASIGNHAQGVAIAARALGMKSTIYMPVWATKQKISATESYGANVVLIGENILETIARAKIIAEKEGKLFIHPYDDSEVTAGQGTIGLEILEQADNIGSVIVPVGGGGLIAGIAVTMHWNAQVFGVQAHACPAAFKSFLEGRPVLVKQDDSVADAIMVPEIGTSDFNLIKKHVDGIFLVNEADIRQAIMLLLRRKRIVVEGAGATPLAALIAHKNGTLATTGKIINHDKCKKVILIVSGGNIEENKLIQLLSFQRGYRY